MCTDTSKQKSNQPDRGIRFGALSAAALLGMILSTPALATLNQNCIVAMDRTGNSATLSVTVTRTAATGTVIK